MHPHCQRCVWDCRAQQSTWSFKSGREGGVHSLTFSHSNLGSYMDVTSWECLLPCHLWHILGSNLSKHSLLPKPFLFVSSSRCFQQKAVQSFHCGSHHSCCWVTKSWIASIRLEPMSSHLPEPKVANPECPQYQLLLQVHRMQLNMLTHTFTIIHDPSYIFIHSIYYLQVRACAHACRTRRLRSS